MLTDGWIPELLEMSGLCNSGVCPQFAVHHAHPCTATWWDHRSPESISIECHYQCWSVRWKTTFTLEEEIHLWSALHNCRAWKRCNLWNDALRIPSQLTANSEGGKFACILLDCSTAADLKAGIPSFSILTVRLKLSMSQAPPRPGMMRSFSP